MNNQTQLQISDYQIEPATIRSLVPSPENDMIYGAVQDDEQMDALVESIRIRGLQEPILISDDAYIVSGHRRYHACKRLGYGAPTTAPPNG